MQKSQEEKLQQKSVHFVQILVKLGYYRRYVI